MEKTRLLFLIFALCIVSTLCSRGCPSTWFCCLARPETMKGTCYATGYVPGGNKVILEPIEAPQAVLQDHSIGIVANKLGYVLDTGGAMADIVALTEKFEPWGKFLAGGLGVWGSIIGVVANIGTPTPDDIIAACNEALSELTDEVNQQFDNMQAYVDQAILQADKELMNLDYRQYHNYFTDCVNEVTEKDMWSCVQEAERLSGSDHAKFLRYEEKMNQEGWVATPDDVKRMEVLFLTFRDYAQLRMMIYLTLTGYYQNQTNNEDAAKLAKRYLQDLRDDIALYIKYTNFVYKTISDMHNVQDTFLQNNIGCDDVQEVHEGWNVHTWDRLYCRYLFSPMLISTETCDYNGEVRAKSDCPCPHKEDGRDYCELYWTVEGKSDSWNVIREDGYWFIKPKFDNYTSQMKESVSNYWKPQVIDNCLPNWQKLYDQVVVKLQDYENVRAVEKSEVLSMKSKAKLYEAKERRSKIGEEWGKGPAPKLATESTPFVGRGSKPVHNEL
eukprot:TCONS_00065764-protein